MLRRWLCQQMTNDQVPETHAYIFAVWKEECRRESPSNSSAIDLVAKNKVELLAHAWTRYLSRYVLPTKRDDKRIAGGKTKRSWKWGSRVSRVSFEIETVRDISDEAEFTSIHVS